MIDHLASHGSPPELGALMRAELAALRHLPGEELTGQRGRLEQRRRHLDEQYEWSMINAATYRAKRAEVDAELGELPPPAASNVLAFDRAAARILPLGASLRDMPGQSAGHHPAHRGARRDARPERGPDRRPRGGGPVLRVLRLGATKDATHDATHEVDGCGEYAQHNDPLNQSHYVHSSACSCVAPPEGRADRITLLARYA